MARKKKTTTKTNIHDNNNKSSTNNHQTCLPTTTTTTAMLSTKPEITENNSKSNGNANGLDGLEPKDVQGDDDDVVVAIAVQNRNENNCNCKMDVDSDDQMSEQKTLKYQSDSELMDLKNYEKNKSNLFLIKSYSFIDKTNSKKRIQNGGNSMMQLKEIQMNGNFTRNIMENRNEKTMKNSKQEKIVKTLEKPEKPEKSEKSKKPPKLKKLKKAKSTHDSTENLYELQQLLRKRPPATPSIILQDVNNAKRPLSLPITANHHPNHHNHNHKPVAKAKTLDDLETPRLKRDSFLRHSLQSIRRSFSSSKKSTNSSHISCSSNSSSSSSSNCSSVSVPNKKSFKTKDQHKDVANLSEIEEDVNYLIAVKEEEDQAYCNSNATSTYSNNITSAPCDINDGSHDLIDGSAAIISTHVTRHSPLAGGLHSTMDSSSLAVLKEEDEKDVNYNVNNNNNNLPPCDINKQR